MKNNISVIFRNLEVVNFKTLSDAYATIAAVYKCDISHLYHNNNTVVNTKFKGNQVWIAGKNIKTPIAIIYY